MCDDLCSIVVGIVAGFLFSIYAGCIVARFQEFYGVLRELVSEVSLLSGLIRHDSYDFGRGPDAPRLLHCFSVQVAHMGHKEAAQAMRDLADEIDEAFTFVRRQHPKATVFNISAQKYAWVKRTLQLQPSWLAIFNPLPCRWFSGHLPFEVYAKKEIVLVNTAIDDTRRRNEKVEDLPPNWRDTLKISPPSLQSPPN